MKQGEFYLFANPWFWTFVGRYVRHANFQEIEIADAIYFRRTGADFATLCKTGLVRSGESKTQYFGPLPAGTLIPAGGIKIPWLAETPWAKGR